MLQSGREQDRVRPEAEEREGRHEQRAACGHGAEGRADHGGANGARRDPPPRPERRDQRVVHHDARGHARHADVRRVIAVDSRLRTPAEHQGAWKRSNLDACGHQFHGDADRVDAARVRYGVDLRRPACARAKLSRGRDPGDGIGRAPPNDVGGHGGGPACDRRGQCPSLADAREPNLRLRDREREVGDGGWRRGGRLTARVADRHQNREDTQHGDAASAGSGVHECSRRRVSASTRRRV